MIKKLTYGMAAASLAALFSTTANARLIDDFIDAPQAIRILGPETIGLPDQVVTRNNNDGGDLNFDNVINAADLALSELGAQSTILGGYRDITTTLVVAGAGDSTNSRAAVNAGSFSHAQDPTVGSHSSVKWDSNDGSLGSPSVDLTDGGLSDRFHLVITFADLGIWWSLEVLDGDGSSDIEYFESAAISTATAAYVQFTAFSPTIDFANINKIVFSANIDNPLVDDPDIIGISEADQLAVDTTVCLIQTVGSSFVGGPTAKNCSAVPEPASLTLLGAGIMGLGYFGKRRRKA